MKQKAMKTVEVEIEEVTAIICDNCKKDLSKDERPYYFEVTTHHNDWGNDSADSYNDSDICGLSCLRDHITRYFTRANGTEEYQVERIAKPKKKV